MENKKTKLTLSGIAKKSIENIELAKTQSKNSVVIEKKPSKFAPRGNFTRPASVRSKPAVTTASSFTPRTTSSPKPSSPITNDYEKRKLAEQSHSVRAQKVRHVRFFIRDFWKNFKIEKKIRFGFRESVSWPAKAGFLPILRKFCVDHFSRLLATSETPKTCI